MSSMQGAMFCMFGMGVVFFLFGFLYFFDLVQLKHRGMSLDESVEGGLTKAPPSTQRPVDIYSPFVFESHATLHIRGQNPGFPFCIGLFLPARRMLPVSYLRCSHELVFSDDGMFQLAVADADSDSETGLRLFPWKFDAGEKVSVRFYSAAELMFVGSRVVARGTLVFPSHAAPRAVRLDLDKWPVVYGPPTPGMRTETGEYALHIERVFRLQRTHELADIGIDCTDRVFVGAAFFFFDGAEPVARVHLHTAGTVTIRTHSENFLNVSAPGIFEVRPDLFVTKIDIIYLHVEAGAVIFTPFLQFR